MYDQCSANMEGMFMSEYLIEIIENLQKIILTENLQKIDILTENLQKKIPEFLLKICKKITKKYI